MSDPIQMSVTCGGCGQRLFNDDPEIAHPLDFIRACEARGWSASTNPPRAPTCPSCLAKGKT